MSEAHHCCHHHHHRPLCFSLDGKVHAKVMLGPRGLSRNQPASLLSGGMLMAFWDLYLEVAFGFASSFSQVNSRNIPPPMGILH